MKMLDTIKIIPLLALIAMTSSCKSTFNASEAMQTEENRNAIYQEIISNPEQFTEFLSEAKNNEEAQNMLMKSHMEQMESGNMEMMMKNDPEMKEKMKSHMQKMMDKNPEKQEKMQEKMLNKMMQSEQGRKMLLDKIHSNEKMKKAMKEWMKRMKDEDPEMTREK